MADINKYFEFLKPWEGGFVNDKTDSGGATNMGVTLATWRSMGYDKDNDGDIDSDDIKILDEADAKMVLKKGYWDKWKADQIINQSVAEMLVDWVWGSGNYGIKIPQSILGVTPDGIVGNATLCAVNTSVAKDLFESLKASRLKFIDNIIANDIVQCYCDLSNYIQKHSLTEKHRRDYRTLELYRKYKEVPFTLSAQDILKYTNKKYEVGWKRRVSAIKFYE